MSDTRAFPSGASEKSIRESGRFASRRSSRRCLSVMGRVKSAFAATRFSGRDDADFFFAILFLACVNYQQERDAPVMTNSVPTLLVLIGAIRIRNRVGILKDPRRCFE